MSFIKLVEQAANIADMTGGDWQDEEIERFSKRVASLQNHGLSEMEAQKLAETMLYRDRPDSGDDRRICLECKGLRGRVCDFAKALGLRAGHEPARFTLQRCDGFALKGAK